MTHDPIGAAAGFSSVYGQLMTLSDRLSDEQMTALRELDGMLAAAEHAMAGTPVGVGAHSTVCGFIMNAYAQGAAAERQRIKDCGAVSACCGAEYHREPGKYGRWQCHACGTQCDLIGTIG